MPNEIALTQGRVAIVDARDFETLSQFNWVFNNGYASRRCNPGKARCHEYMHKRILPTTDGRVIIHLDGNRLNNRRHNLMLVDKRVRQQRVAARGPCGYKGVTFVRDLYMAQIHVMGKTKHLGRYTQALDAARAYDLAALHHYGLAARLNFQLTAHELAIIARGK